LPPASPGYNPPVLVPEFARQLETLLVGALHKNTIRLLGRIGTEGVAPFNTEARGRGDIEILLEIVTTEYVDESDLFGLANMMRTTALSLFTQEQYQGGSYDDLSVVAIAIVNRGALVSG